MKSSCALIAIFSLLLIAVSTTESRKDLAKDYWRDVMKDQPMPKAIYGLINSHSVPENHDHHHENAFNADFKPIPDVTAYPDDQKPKAKTVKGTKSFTDEFDPSPNVSVYTNDITDGHENHHHHNHEIAFTADFKPIPDATAYPDSDNDKTEAKTGKGTNPFTDEFDPSPNISVYDE